jgi:hypothetical protein
LCLLEEYIWMVLEEKIKGIFELSEVEHIWNDIEIAEWSKSKIFDLAYSPEEPCLSRKVPINLESCSSERNSSNIMPIDKLSKLFVDFIGEFLPALWQVVYNWRLSFN